MEKFKFEGILAELELSEDNAKIKPSTRKSIKMIREIKEKLGGDDITDDEYEQMKQDIADLDTRICDMLEMQFDEVVEDKKKKEEEAKRKAEAEAKRKAEEEAKAKAEAEAKRKAEEEAKAKAEAEAKRKAEEEAEAKRKAEEEAKAKKRAELEKKAEERRKKIEEEKKKKKATPSARIIDALDERGYIHYKALSEILGKNVSAPRVQVGKLILDNEPFTDFYKAVNAGQIAGEAASA